MAPGTTPVQAVQAGKRTHFRWVVLVLAILAQMISLADRTNIGVVLPALKREFVLTNVQAGALVSVYFVGYTLLQIPAGFIISRFSFRGLITGALCAFAVSTGMIGTAVSAFQLKLYRFLLGITEAPVMLGLTATIKNWFPPNERGTATGLWTGMNSVAITVTAPVAVWIMVHSGWRAVFYIFAIPGLIVAFFWYVFARRTPQESPYCSAAEAEYIASGGPSSGSAGAGQKRNKGDLGWLDRCIRLKKCGLIETKFQAFTSKNIIGVSIAYAFSMAVNFGLMAWLPSYLLAVKGLTLMKMGWASGAPWLGGCLGTICGGTVSDRLLGGRRKPMIMVGTLSTIFMLRAITTVGSGLMTLGVILFGTGFCIYLSLSCLFAYPMGLTTQRTFPVALSILMTAGNIGVGLSPLVVGYLLDVLKSYGAMFIFLQACAFLAFLFITAIDEPA